MLKDLRYAVRMLWHARGWTTVMVLLLALGIGANTALFSAVNGLLLTDLPVRDPGTLVRLLSAGPNDMVTHSSGYGSLRESAQGEPVRASFSYPMFQQFVADNRTLVDLFACAPLGRVNVVADGHAEIASAFIASGNYHQVLGVTARLGRTIGPGDDQPTAPPAAVISSAYWHTRFGTDPAVVGKTVRINDVPVTIVGVISPEFTGVQRPVDDPPDISVPLALEAQLKTEEGPSRLNQPTSWWLQIVGRLKPGATAAQVQGNLEGVFQRTARAGLDSYMGSLAETQRATARNRSRTDVPRLLVKSGRRGVYDVNTNDVASVAILGAWSAWSC